MEITNDFPGANIRILSVKGDEVRLAVDLRDTSGDWFYWCFKVEGAGGKTVTFRFENNHRVGYYGAAVSHDARTWQWQYSEKGHEGDCFTYTFGESENEVRFAHDMLYRPDRFFEFAREHALAVKTLCTSEKGRDVPFLDIGSSDEVILLTARHHACESTGSYVLEGVLGELLRDPHFQKYRILCIPFVDLDGVLDGDQGKNRSPHDHNRDYDPSIPAIYEATARIRNIAEGLNIKYAFDFHSPWHLGSENDTVFIPVKSRSLVEKTEIFSRLWESENTPETLPHFAADDLLPDVRWNRSGAPTASVFFAGLGAALACSVETPYFCAGEIAFMPERALEEGKCFAKALKKYDLGDRA